MQHQKTMTDEEMNQYIDNIERTPLFDEVRRIVSNPPHHPYPRYLGTICISLVALGYDEKWVNTTFKEALTKRYLRCGVNKA